MASTGSYYIRVFKNGWGLYHQYFENGEKVDKRVPDLALHTLGFGPNMSVAEARKKKDQLNKERKNEAGTIRKAASRVEAFTSMDERLFPPETLTQFLIKLENTNQGSESHLKKVHSHFKAVQRLCKDLNLEPYQYEDNQTVIHRWFEKNRISVGYADKLIDLLNRWGRFVSRDRGAFYEDVAHARGIMRERIREAQEGKKGVRRASKPLNPKLLAAKKPLLSEQNYNWLFISFWFGLRPVEVNSLLLKYDVEENDEGTAILIVYQSKLRSIERSKRFKGIHLLFPEQAQALKIIEAKNFKAPLYKTMKTAFKGITLYGGRKAFQDYMLQEGYSKDQITLWLGHQSPETTWQYYREKDATKLPTPKRIA